MSIEPLNTSSIQQFIQQVKSAESSRARELRLDMNQAKNLAFTLGIVMARMNGDLEKFVKENAGGDIGDIEVVIGADSDWK
tara:strand:- start:8260 stop:8502 length:243 start_codon:yes stop_codon:yes gene_type:complete